MEQILLDYQPLVKPYDKIPKHLTSWVSDPVTWSYLGCKEFQLKPETLSDIYVYSVTGGFDDLLLKHDEIPDVYNVLMTIAQQNPKSYQKLEYWLRYYAGVNLLTCGNQLLGYIAKIVPYMTTRNFAILDGGKLVYVRDHSERLEFLLTELSGSLTLLTDDITQFDPSTSGSIFAAPAIAAPYYPLETLQTIDNQERVLTTGEKAHLANFHSRTTLPFWQSGLPSLWTANNTASSALIDRPDAFKADATGKTDVAALVATGHSGVHRNLGTFNPTSFIVLANRGEGCCGYYVIAQLLGMRVDNVLAIMGKMLYRNGPIYIKKLSNGYYVYCDAEGRLSWYWSVDGEPTHEQLVTTTCWLDDADKSYGNITEHPIAPRMGLRREDFTAAITVSSTGQKIESRDFVYKSCHDENGVYNKHLLGHLVSTEFHQVERDTGGRVIKAVSTPLKHQFVPNSNGFQPFYSCSGSAQMTEGQLWAFLLLHVDYKMTFVTNNNIIYQPHSEQETQVYVSIDGNPASGHWQLYFPNTAAGQALHNQLKTMGQKNGCNS